MFDKCYKQKVSDKLESWTQASSRAIFHSVRTVILIYLCASHCHLATHTGTSSTVSAKVLEVFTGIFVKTTTQGLLIPRHKKRKMSLGSNLKGVSTGATVCLSMADVAAFLLEHEHWPIDANSI